MRALIGFERSPARPPTLLGLLWQHLLHAIFGSGRTETFAWLRPYLCLPRFVAGAHGGVLEEAGRQRHRCERLRRNLQHVRV